jgi:hypothetical protein
MAALAGGTIVVAVATILLVVAIRIAVVVAIVAVVAITVVVIAIVAIAVVAVVAIAVVLIAVVVVVVVVVVVFCCSSSWRTSCPAFGSAWPLLGTGGWFPNIGDCSQPQCDYQLEVARHVELAQQVEEDLVLRECAAVLGR